MSLHFCCRLHWRSRYKLAFAIPSKDSAAQKVHTITERLIECGVSKNAFLNLSLGHPETEQVKYDLKRGVPAKENTYCDLVLPTPVPKYEGVCPWCSCDPTNELGLQLVYEELVAL